MAEVIMPKMGDAMTEGKVLRWIKHPGDRVAKGEAIAEIETDKVNVEIESEWDGTVARLLVGAGEVAAVGAPIALIARPGEVLDGQAAQAPATDAARPVAPATTALVGSDTVPVISAVGVCAQANDETLYPLAYQLGE